MTAYRLTVLAALVLRFIACFILLVIAPLVIGRSLVRVSVDPPGSDPGQVIQTHLLSEAWRLNRRIMRCTNLRILHFTFFTLVTEISRPKFNNKRECLHTTVVRGGQCMHAGQLLQVLHTLPPADNWAGTGTHRRRRRDETVELRRVGVGGAYMNSQLAHDDCRRIRRCERSRWPWPSLQFCS